MRPGTSGGRARERAVAALEGCLVQQLQIVEQRVRKMSDIGLFFVHRPMGSWLLVYDRWEEHTRCQFELLITGMQ